MPFGWPGVPPNMLPSPICVHVGPDAPCNQPPLRCWSSYWKLSRRKCALLAGCVDEILLIIFLVWGGFDMLGVLCVVSGSVGVCLSCLLVP